MVTNTISLSNISHAEFGSVRAHLERAPGMTWKVNNSRLVHYLCHMWHIVQKALEDGRTMKNAEQCALHYEKAIIEALTWTPPHVSRGPYQKSIYATKEQREYIAMKIRERLGINPTEGMVSEAINSGGEVGLREIARLHLSKQRDALGILTDDMVPKSPEQAALETLQKNMPAGLPAADETCSRADDASESGSSVEPDAGSEPDLNKAPNSP